METQTLAPEGAVRQAAAPETGPERKPFKWGFLSASSVILFVATVGEFVGRTSGGLGKVLSVWEGGSLRLWMVRLFLLCTAGWAWTARASIKRYFRSMVTGVSLVVISTIAVTLGVLVPQIDGFEDPAVRVTPENYDDQYKAFQWAEGYFLYHMLHLYGIGMPEPDYPPGALDSLELFGDKYGLEERENRLKRMDASFSGSKKTEEIRHLLLGQDPSSVSRAIGLLLREGLGEGPAADEAKRDAIPAFTNELRGDLRAFRSRYHRELAAHAREDLFPTRDAPVFLGAGDRLDLLAEAVRTDLETFLSDNAAAFRSGIAADVVPRALELVREHDYFGRDADMRGFFNVSTFLQLNRAYKSGWFATLLTLLGVAIAMNTFVGPPRTWVTYRRAGFFVTHLGMMTMLIGGAISKIETKRGILHLDLEAPPQNEYLLHYDRNQPTKLPFHVGLENFARKEWMQLQVEFPREGFRTMPPTYTLWEGKEIDLDYTKGEDGEMRPRTRLVARELHDRARIDVSMREAVRQGEAGVFGAAVQYDIEEPGRDKAVGVILPEFRPDLIDPSWQFRLQAAYGDFEPETLVGTFPREGAPIGVLYVLNSASGEAQPKPMEITPGGSYETPTGYTIHVRDAVADYQVSRATGNAIRDGGQLGERAPSNPAVWIEITPPAGGPAEERLVRQSVDADSMGLQSKYENSELLTWLIWDSWSAPGPPRYFLHWGPERDPVLVAESGEMTPVTAEAALPLVDRDGNPTLTRVVPTVFHRRAVLDKKIEFLPPTVLDGLDVDFYAHDARGMVLDVIRDPGTKDESVTTVEMVTGEPTAERWRSPDGVLDLKFFENTALLPFEWRSVLSIYETNPDGTRGAQVDAGSPVEREIRVNDYFKWKGYRFFQTNASADFPTYSGIGVVYDPGIPIVLAGMYTIILGTVLAFIVRPIVLASRKKAKQEIQGTAA